MKKFLGTMTSYAIYFLGNIAYNIGYPEAYKSCIFWIYFIQGITGAINPKL